MKHAVKHIHFVVVGAGEQNLEFKGVHLTVQGRHLGIRVLLHGILSRRRFRLPQIQQLPHIGGPLLKRHHGFHPLFQLVRLFDHLLRQVLVAPELIRRHLRVVLGNAPLGAGQIHELAQLAELGRQDVQVGPGDFKHRARKVGALREYMFGGDILSPIS